MSDVSNCSQLCRGKVSRSLRVRCCKIMKKGQIRDIYSLLTSPRRVPRKTLKGKCQCSHRFSFFISARSRITIVSCCVGEKSHISLKRELYETPTWTWYNLPLADLKSKYLERQSQRLLKGKCYRAALVTRYS